jgi:hypothetical protein
MALCPHFIGSALEQLNLRLDLPASGLLQGAALNPKT